MKPHMGHGRPKGRGTVYPTAALRRVMTASAEHVVSFPDRLSSACIAAIRAGVGWVWDQDK